MLEALNKYTSFVNVSNKFDYLYPFSFNKFLPVRLRLKNENLNIAANNKKRRKHILVRSDISKGSNFHKLVKCVTKKGKGLQALRTVVKSFLFIRKISRINAFFLLNRAIFRCSPMFRLIKLSKSKTREVYLPKLLAYTTSRNMAIRSVLKLAFEINRKEICLYKSIAYALPDCAFYKNSIVKRVKKITYLAHANKHILNRRKRKGLKDWYYANTMRVIHRKLSFRYGTLY